MSCRVLKVSSSGYYRWCQQEEARKKKAAEEQRLTELVEKIFYGSNKAYGSPRVYDILLGLNEKCGVNKVAAIMRKNDLRSVRRLKYRPTTDSNHKLPVAPNLLMQDFSTNGINQIWLSDITDIKTRAGISYLAAVIDLHSRRAIGWHVSKRRDADLVVTALKMALQHRDTPENLVFHSDQGSQYASGKCLDLLKLHDITTSMSRRANCWDNSPMESFFATFKTEFYYQQDFKDHGEATLGIFYWMEATYNNTRIHTSIGRITPAEFERRLNLADSDV